MHYDIIYYDDSTHTAYVGNTPIASSSSSYGVTIGYSRGQELGYQYLDTSFTDYYSTGTEIQKIKVSDTQYIQLSFKLEEFFTKRYFDISIIRELMESI